MTIKSFTHSHVVPKPSAFFHLWKQMKIFLMKPDKCMSLHSKSMQPKWCCFKKFIKAWSNNPYEQRGSLNLLKRGLLYMMNTSNLNFYSHINIDQHTHTHTELIKHAKRKFKHACLMRNQWGLFSHVKLVSLNFRSICVFWSMFMCVYMSTLLL